MKSSKHNMIRLAGVSVCAVALLATSPVLAGTIYDSASRTQRPPDDSDLVAWKGIARAGPASLMQVVPDPTGSNLEVDHGLSQFDTPRTVGSLKSDAELLGMLDRPPPLVVATEDAYQWAGDVETESLKAAALVDELEAEYYGQSQEPLGELLFALLIATGLVAAFRWGWRPLHVGMSLLLIRAGGDPVPSAKKRRYRSRSQRDRQSSWYFSARPSRRRRGHRHSGRRQHKRGGSWKRAQTRPHYRRTHATVREYVVSDLIITTGSPVATAAQPRGLLPNQGSS